jgi:hypothetical protein
MRETNKAVQREKHPMPTVDELITDLNGATVFSTLDLASGYHPESRHITTFTTHVGLRRYKRLMFGVNAASEIFQNEIANLLVGLPGCKNISDDIIVYGRDDKEHGENLRGVLNRLQDNNAKLNGEKCSFRQHQVVFFGHTCIQHKWSSGRPKEDRHHPEYATSKKCQRSQVPSRNDPVRISVYPQLCLHHNTLRTLTHQNAKWQWQAEQENALKKLQHELTNDPVMAYFDPSKPTTVIVDTSPSGLGALLTHSSYQLCKSCTFQCRIALYSQTEREMLAVIWAIEHYHLYHYGVKFTIITDHKLLLRIFKSQKPTSARIDR